MEYSIYGFVYERESLQMAIIVLSTLRVCDLKGLRFRAKLLLVQHFWNINSKIVKVTWLSCCVTCIGS